MAYELPGATLSTVSTAVQVPLLFQEDFSLVLVSHLENSRPPEPETV